FLYGWDDQWFVTNHYTENGLNWSNLSDILTHFHYGQYAPLNQIYYTALYSLFGYNPAYYHITSVVLHICNVILVYTLVSRIAPNLLQDRQVSKRIPFITGFLFAILPVNVEPV